MTWYSASWDRVARSRLIEIAVTLAAVVAASWLPGRRMIGGEPVAVRAEPGGWEFSRMRQVVEDHCLRCHGTDKSRGGLNLSTLHGWMRGGDSGPALQVNDPDASATVRRAREGSMPPIGDGRALTVEELDAVVAWILSGAHWPDGMVLANRRPEATAAQGCGFAGFAPKRSESRRSRARNRRGGRSIG